MIRSKSGKAESIVEPALEAAVAEFIRINGVTRCPTACLAPTQGSVAPEDRAALELHVQARASARRERSARNHPFTPIFGARLG